MNRVERSRVAWSSSVLLLSAAVDNAPCAEGPAASITPVAGLFQVVFALAVVLAAIVLFGWLLRRWMPASMGASGVLRIVGGVMVGPKERLVLVEMGDTWLLLGVAAGGVNLLHHMPRPQTAGAAAPAAGASRFARLLKRAAVAQKEG